MNIIVFAHFAGSPRHGMVFGHYYLAREWVRAGHSVTIIAASFTHLRSGQPEAQGRHTEEFIDGIRYIWVPTPAYRPEQAAGRALNIVAYSVRCWLARFAVERADLVVCSSHHPFAFHAARRMARRMRARLVFEVRDLWPLTLIELGKASRNHPFIRAMQWSEDHAYKHADRVVSVLPDARGYMVGRGMKPEKFAHIPNGVDLSALQATETLPAGHVLQLERQRAEGRFLIGYAGRIGEANALQTLIDAVASCDDDGVAAAIIGEGQHLEAIRAHARQLGVSDRIVFLEPVPKAQVQDFLRRVDAAYIGLRGSALFRHGVSPTKINDYMLAARPIICAIDTPDSVVEQSGAGFVCAPEDPAALGKAIFRLRGLTAPEREALGENGLRWIRANRDYRVLARRFLQAAAEADGAGDP